MLLNPNTYTPLPEIKERLSNGETIKGSPIDLLKACESLNAKNSYRIWTFKTPLVPSKEIIGEFMEEFVAIFSRHRLSGKYKSAWWKVEDPDDEQFIFEGLFADTNPETNGDFYQRAKEGPILAMWYGKRFEIMEATKLDPEEEDSFKSVGSFAKRAMEHLAYYKENELGINEPGIYNYRRREIPKRHILPTKEIEKNILEKYRTDFFTSIKDKSIKLHPCFHHLNSSQAMCINLFYPLMQEHSLDDFLQFAEINLDAPITGEFEKESEIEKNAQRLTSFDFYMKDSCSRKVFVEVKYTESGFGKAQRSKDEDREKYHNKFEVTYLPLLKKATRFLNPRYCEETAFLDNYQLMRNLVHIDDDSHLILLFPSANDLALKEATHAKDNFLTKEGQERFRIVYLEDLVSFLLKEMEDEALECYYKEFASKYCFYNQITSTSDEAIMA